MPVFGSIASFSSSLAAGKSGPGRPGLPTVGTPVRVTGSGTSIDVPFTAPASNGGIPINAYTAVSNPGNITGTISQSGSGTIRVNGLTPGVSYTFTVYATNPRGNSPNTSASSGVVPATVPGAPTIGTATTTGQTTATISFTAPANNGSAITSYTAVSSPGGITATLNQSGSGTITMSGLTAGTAYTFTVYATNGLGNSSSSSASNSITTQSPNPEVEYLVVAAGGSGGSAAGGSPNSGAGGAGGVLNATSTSGFAFNTWYTVTIGAGVSNANGQNSSIVGYNLNITALGGGVGANGSSNPGQNGGSGGGSGNYPLRSGGYGTPGQGNNGSGIPNGYDLGGGGGAGEEGVNASGGAGRYFSNFTTNGSPAGWYGGGGHSNVNSAGQIITNKGGGGGNFNGCAAGSPGTANTGGGGGGNHGGCNNFADSGRSGGSGIVLIRYSTSHNAATTTGSPTLTTSGGFRTYAFTGSGTFLIPS